MKTHRFLMAAVVAFFSLNLTVCAEEKATTPAIEESAKPAEARGEATAKPPADTAQVPASTENVENKSDGAAAPAQAEAKDEKKAEGGAEPDCN